MQGPWTNFHSVPCGKIHSLGYIYDMANRRTQMNLPDGTKWLYGYDRLSQVVSGERVAAATGAPVDGAFPAHTPNPLAPEAWRDAAKAVRENALDCAVIFDGDADRAVFLDETGAFVMYRHESAPSIGT